MNRIYLSPPNMLGREREMLLDAFDSNWIAPLGPHVSAFETEFAAKVGMPYAAALSSGTAALHLALKILGIGSGDEVLTSSFTFASTANAITYVGAKPVFVDSERSSWNLDPNLLRAAILDRQRNRVRPKAVLAVDILGQCCDYESIQEICQEFEIPLIEDAAEALGATYRERWAGNFGAIGCFSFNGNKIITTSSGGMVVTRNQEWAEKIRFLATQARDPAPHYEHSHIGYNYRMSNLLAAIGRAQLEMIDVHVTRRRAIRDWYKKALTDLPGISFMPETPGGRANAWLTAILIDPSKFGASREDVRLALESENIESRPTWKPMHAQPVFANCIAYKTGVSDRIFEQGLCLPSGSALQESELNRIVHCIKKAAKRA